MQNKIAKIILSITSDKRHIPIEIIGTTQKSIFSHFIIIASKRINKHFFFNSPFLSFAEMTSHEWNQPLRRCVLGLRRWIEIGISGRRGKL